MKSKKSKLKKRVYKLEDKVEDTFDDFKKSVKKTFVEDNKKTAKQVKAIYEQAKKEEVKECLCCKNNCQCCDHQGGTGPLHTCKCRCHA